MTKRKVSKARRPMKKVRRQLTSMLKNLEKQTTPDTAPGTCTRWIYCI